MNDVYQLLQELLCTLLSCADCDPDFIASIIYALNKQFSIQFFGTSLSQSRWIYRTRTG